MPGRPAFGVKPGVVFAGPEWENHGARRFGLPHHAQRPTGEGIGLRFSHSTMQDANAWTSASAASTHRHAPESPRVRRNALANLLRSTRRSHSVAHELSVFSRFSRFSSAHPRQQISASGAVGDDGDDSISLPLMGRRLGHLNHLNHLKFEHRSPSSSPTLGALGGLGGCEVRNSPP